MSRTTSRGQPRPPDGSKIGDVICDKWQLQKYLGAGSFGKVFGAVEVASSGGISRGCQLAVKCVDATRLNSDARDNLMMEIKLMKSLSHPNVVKVFDFDAKGSTVYIVMELCNGGDLAEVIKQHRRLNEKTASGFMKQLARALEFLDKAGVAHLDLKPANIMVVKDSNSSITLKLADFGYASLTKGKRGGAGNDGGSNQLRGSPLYMAPESVLERQYDSRCDLWSAGVILHEMIFGWAPFHSASYDELIAKIVSTDPVTLPKKQPTSKFCEDLLLKLLQRDPKDRISLKAFCKHKFLKGIGLLEAVESCKTDSASFLKTIRQMELEDHQSTKVSITPQEPDKEPDRVPSRSKSNGGVFGWLTGVFDWSINNVPWRPFIEKAFLAEADGKDLKAYALFVHGIDLIVKANESESLSKLEETELKKSLDASYHVYVGRAEAIKNRYQEMDRTQNSLREDVLGQLKSILPSEAALIYRGAVLLLHQAAEAELLNDLDEAFTKFQDGIGSTMSIIKDYGSMLTPQMLSFIKADMAQSLSRVEQISDTKKEIERGSIE